MRICLLLYRITVHLVFTLFQDVLWYIFTVQLSSLKSYHIQLSFFLKYKKSNHISHIWEVTMWLIQNCFEQLQNVHASVHYMTCSLLFAVFHCYIINQSQKILFVLTRGISFSINIHTPFLLLVSSSEAYERVCIRLSIVSLAEKWYFLSWKSQKVEIVRCKKILIFEIQEICICDNILN